MNTYGLIIIVIVMIPNIIFAIKEKNFENKYNNKIVEIIVQIGRFGSICLMIFNITLFKAIKENFLYGNNDRGI